jgi:methylated-DNA-protein-cysteine methyltransferase related protein
MQKNFFKEVYEVVKLIPEGKVTTYGAIAQYLGTKGGARMVGWAMNSAHTEKDVPAHRVVNRNGRLTGKHFFETSETMQTLLEKEGLKIIEDEIDDFQRNFWDPNKELAL